MEEGRQTLLFECGPPKHFTALKRNGEQVLTEDILQFNLEKAMIMPRCTSSALLPI